MTTRNKIHVAVLLSALTISGLATATDIPQWWHTRGLVNTNLIANDYAPVNIGQLKQVAYQTWLEVTNAVANPRYTAQASATITNSSTPDGTFKVTTEGKLMLKFGGKWFSFTPDNPVPVPVGMVWVLGGTLPDIGNGVMTVSDFYIGRYEVTWGEWQTVRTWAVTNGYDLSGVGAGCADNHPVHSVDWYSVVKWCNARSEKEGRTPVYKVGGTVYKIGENDSVTVNTSANGYRLPTDAEWEYAARGGTQSHGYTYSGGNDINALGWYDGNSGGAACNLRGDGRGTWPVGSKLANELGLYDMNGNVWEWCFEWFPEYDGSYRVVRGGSWFDNANDCRTSYRNHCSPIIRYSIIAFRLAVSIGQ